MRVGGYSEVEAECPDGAHQPWQFGQEELSISGVEEDPERVGHIAHHRQDEHRERHPRH